MKRNGTPTSKESAFLVTEQFFSITDKKGLIQFGNEVFTRISGYAEKDLIGSPHNIIRHPDMPRSVFKIFWDSLKKGLPIGAYVKNMSVDGSFYWVFAFAFPVEDGYLSIRFKPTSALFKVVSDLYAEVLQKEKASTMQEGEDLINQKLKELGFNSYKEFMIHASIEELKSHENLNQHSTVENKVILNDKVMDEITNINLASVKALNQSFLKIDLFQEGSGVFINTIQLLEAEFRKLSMLSLNMSILASNSGERAATLAIVSQEFSSISGQIKEYINSFSNFTRHLTEVINKCSLNLSALKIQMNMVTFFVKASAEKKAFTEMLKCKNIFIDLFSASARNLTEHLLELEGELKAVESRIFEIQRFMNGLRIIRQTGRIESARQDDLEKAFGVYLKEMSNFINLLQDAVKELNQQKEHLLSGTTEVRSLTASIKDNISNIFSLALTKSA